MKINDTIDGLINIPRRFNSVGNMSIYNLLKETGYFEIHDQISVKNILNVLAQYSECVEDWIVYSENQRCSPCWYIKPQDDQKYVVGFYEEGNHTETEYSDRLEACAIYIKHEIESTRALSS